MGTFAPAAHEAGKFGEIQDVRSSDMSTVYFAENGGNPVVIKELPDNPSDVLRARFVLEASALAALDHPQIPRLVEDHSQDEKPYFVMTKQPGSGDISGFYEASYPRLAAYAVISALEPVQEVHIGGFIHGDLKPGNILFENPAIAHVVDFGSVKPRPYEERIGSGEIPPESAEYRLARDHFRAFTEGLTEDENVIGSIRYLSPEELRGLPPDITSDIYSMGAVLYEMLYGKPAHIRPSRPEGLEKPPQEILDKLAVEDAVVGDVLDQVGRNGQDTRLRVQIRPEWADEVIDLDPPKDREIPAELIAVVEKATAMDPKERYQTAKEMREGIEIALH